MTILSCLLSVWVSWLLHVALGRLSWTHHPCLCYLKMRAFIHAALSSWKYSVWARNRAPYQQQYAAAFTVTLDLYWKASFVQRKHSLDHYNAICLFCQSADEAVDWCKIQRSAPCSEAWWAERERPAAALKFTLVVSPFAASLNDPAHCLSVLFCTSQWQVVFLHKNCWLFFFSFWGAVWNLNNIVSERKQLLVKCCHAVIVTTRIMWAFVKTAHKFLFLKHFHIDECFGDLITYPWGAMVTFPLYLWHKITPCLMQTNSNNKKKACSIVI